MFAGVGGIGFNASSYGLGTIAGGGGGVHIQTGTVLPFGTGFGWSSTTSGLGRSGGGNAAQFRSYDFNLDDGTYLIIDRHAQNGTANTGGGAGGGPTSGTNAGNAHAAGGSGVVVIQYTI
jgi:hypothetical protein